MIRDYKLKLKANEEDRRSILKAKKQVTNKQNERRGPDGLNRKVQDFVRYGRKADFTVAGRQVREGPSALRTTDGFMTCA